MKKMGIASVIKLTSWISNGFELFMAYLIEYLISLLGVDCIAIILNQNEDGQ